MKKIFITSLFEIGNLCVNVFRNRNIGGTDYWGLVTFGF